MALGEHRSRYFIMLREKEGERERDRKRALCALNFVAL